MRLVIVTGMSGAGKSTALKMLEDARYFCVDNLPESGQRAAARDEGREICLADGDITG